MPQSGWSRRDLLRTAAPLAGVMAGAGSALASDAASQPAPPAPADRRLPSGEPYALAGRRLVFTNWFYVRPGAFGWFDEQGNNISVRGSVGPLGASFRKYDTPLGIRLTARPAERVGPILAPERPWEVGGVSVTSLIRDGELFRMWGRCHGEGVSGFCCFESKDGVRWERPELGQVDVNGSRANNLLDFPAGQIFMDPSAPPAERYKWIAEGDLSREEYEAWQRRYPDRWEARVDRTDAGLIFAVRGAVSPDGLNWRRLPEPLVVEHSDTQIIAYFDERLRKYVIYTRAWMVGPRAPEAAPGQIWYQNARRSIGRTESDTYSDFPLSRTILTPGPEMAPSDVLYTNCRTSVPGAPDHHVMFPAVWRMTDDATSIAVASSPDGQVWNFIPGPPVLETAPFGAWDGGCVFATPNLLELPDGRWVLPYTGYDVPHKYPRGQFHYRVGYAAWPHGRLFALEAPQRGEFATVAILPPGRRARLNALTSRGGSILVEAADAGGTPLPGRSFADALPIMGDQPAAPLRWKEHEDLGAPDGAGIMLRFRMDQAKIFGVEFA